MRNRAWWLWLLVALGASGCKGQPPPAATGSAPRKYDVRGEVVRLPSPDRRASQLMVRHEAIPGFVDRSGQVVGMDAMVMEFDVAPALLPPALAVGDKIALTLVMDWDHPPVAVERVERLPAGTPLEFGPARRGEGGAGR